MCFHRRAVLDLLSFCARPQARRFRLQVPSFWLLDGTLPSYASKSSSGCDITHQRSARYCLFDDFHHDSCPGGYLHLSVLPTFFHIPYHCFCQFGPQRGASTLPWGCVCFHGLYDGGVVAVLAWQAKTTAGPSLHMQHSHRVSVRGSASRPKKNLKKKKKLKKAQRHGRHRQR